MKMLAKATAIFMPIWLYHVFEDFLFHETGMSFREEFIALRLIRQTLLIKTVEVQRHKVVEHNNEVTGARV